MTSATSVPETDTPATGGVEDVDSTFGSGRYRCPLDASF